MMTVDKTVQQRFRLLSRAEIMTVDRIHHNALHSSFEGEINIHSFI